MHPATIGPFQILQELGRGGMGEVYLATDTRLDRQVAIKALPAHLAQEPDRLARFQREAKVLASLNHPGLGAIHGLEQFDGHQYLILEYVDGETLAERIADGPIRVHEALGFARQIAEALEVAHDKGVIHRDLKPGNIMVTPDGVVKVLDFGLARTAEGAPASSMRQGLGDSPTIASPALLHSPTIPGVILGTAGYMSPEQARGKPVDKRSDIFSFGCVLYEMLTGAMPFQGETVADAIGATLHKESDLNLLPAQTPRRVRDLLTNCLAKDRRNRLHDIGDARLELERAIAEPRDSADRVHAPRPLWRSPSVLLSASMLAGAIIIAALALRPSRGVPQAERSVIRSDLSLPKGLVMPTGDRSVAISPDGTQVVIALRQKGSASPPSLHLRDLSRLEFRALPGTGEANYPFWSPDGKSIAFFAERELKRLDLADGIVRTICDAPAGRGGSWGSKGTIVFAPGAVGGLSIVSDSGGAASPITQPAISGESHRVPHMLPDGERFLYYAMGAQTPGVYAFDPATKQPRLAAPGDTEAIFVEPSALVFGRNEHLLIQPFDLASLALTGTPHPIAAAVQWDARRASLSLSISSRGTLVYQPVAQPRTVRLAWMDRKGERTPIPVEPLSLDPQVVVSPDGRRAAVTVAGSRGESLVSVIDLERGVRTSLGDPKEKFSYGVLWTRDGQRVITSDDNQRAQGLAGFPYGGGAPDRFFEGEPDFEYGASSITPDGRTLMLVRVPKRNKVGDIMTLDLNQKSDLKPFMTTPDPEWNPLVSPSGHAVAYFVSNEEYLGSQLRVVAFPEPSAPVQVTSAQVSQSFGWLSASELYWVDVSRKVWSAPVTLKDGQLDVGLPSPMFEGRPLDKDITITDFDIPRERFLIAIEVEPPEDPRLIIVSDWRPDYAGMRPSRK